MKFKNNPGFGVLRCLALAGAMIVCNLGVSHGAIIITGDIARDGGTFWITEITYTVTRNGYVHGVYFNEWTTTDGSPTSVSFAGGSGFTLTNNGTGQLIILSLLYDNLVANIENVSANDGYLRGDRFSALNVIVGETLTLSGGTRSISAGNSNFNSRLNNTTSAPTSFLMDSRFRNFSSAASITPPEPECYCCAGTFCYSLRFSRSWTICF